MAERIIVEGLRELQAAFREMGAAARPVLRSELIPVATVVAARGRELAVGHDLTGEDKGYSDTRDSHPGLLIDSIRPSVTAGSIAVQDAATTKHRYAYNYPRRYEYQAGGARAFLRPALAQSVPEATLALEAAFGRLAAIGGFEGDDT